MGFGKTKQNLTHKISDSFKVNECDNYNEKM
jgi:hypothetical protein